MARKKGSKNKNILNKNTETLLTQKDESTENETTTENIEQVAADKGIESSSATDEISEGEKQEITIKEVSQEVKEKKERKRAELADIVRFRRLGRR